MGLRKRDKKANDLPPMPGLPPMPAPPAPGMPMPPAPGLPLPPNPAAPMPPAPTQIPTPPAPTAPAAPAACCSTCQQFHSLQRQRLNLRPKQSKHFHLVQLPNQWLKSQSKESYAGLYAKKSGKPLQQVYGHIDRIGEGKSAAFSRDIQIDSDMNLDRDIIVMRKEERDDKIAEIRDSPTVQLLNEEAEEESHLDGETIG